MMQEQITNPYMAMSDEFLLNRLEEYRGCNPPECKRICNELRRRNELRKGKKNGNK